MVKTPSMSALETVGFVSTADATIAADVWQAWLIASLLLSADVEHGSSLPKPSLRHSASSDRGLLEDRQA